MAEWLALEARLESLGVPISTLGWQDATQVTGGGGGGRILGVESVKRAHTGPGTDLTLSIPLALLSTLDERSQKGNRPRRQRRGCG